MNNFSKIVKGLWGRDYKDTKEYISANFDENLFETFMAQKGLEKVYRNDLLNDEEKKKVIALLQEVFKHHSSEIENTYMFLECAIPIGEGILQKIREIISSKFPDSLACFYYCTGMYIKEHPDMIGFAKRILIDSAKQCLNNDLALINYSLTLSLTNIYIKLKSLYNEIYEEAVKYGVLVEKYDAVSFNSEYISLIQLDGNRPYIRYQLRDYDFEYGLQCGVFYHDSLVQKRYTEQPGVVHSYYKCLICKRSLWVDIDKDFAFELLNRQYSNMNQTDIFSFIQEISNLIFYRWYRIYIQDL